MWTQVCADADFDVATLTCSNPQWVQELGGFPPLSITDGLEISGAILGVWVLGFIVREIVRVLRKG
jgi:hypothetical protein